MPWSSARPTRFPSTRCWLRSPLSKLRCARCALAVELPAEPGTLAAHLGPEHPDAVAGLALVPQIRKGAPERPIAALAVDHLVAAMVDRLMLIGQRVADVAHRQRLGFLRFHHQQPVPTRTSTRGTAPPHRESRK